MMVDGRAICDPEPCSSIDDSPILCRRGTGSRTMCQGQKIPTCDGNLAVAPDSSMAFPITVYCPKCVLAHMFFVQNEELLYGALL
ncbi:MAG: hypothetical protein ACREDF_09525 [Thermoplasmata archaeon]